MNFLAHMFDEDHDFCPHEDISRRAWQFYWSYGVHQNCAPKVEHLGEGWFMIYDHPSAERWILENRFYPDFKVCNDTQYMMVHFADLHGAMEMKLRWC